LGEGSSPVTIYRDPDATLAKAYNIPDGYKFHGQTVYFPALVLLVGSGEEVFRYVGKSNADRLSYEKISAKLNELTQSSPR
jgi:peroxiredoxin Q/BCP